MDPPTREDIDYLREPSREMLDLSDIPAWMWILLGYIAINMVTVTCWDLWLIPIPRLH